MWFWWSCVVILVVLGVAHQDHQNACMVLVVLFVVLVVLEVILVVLGVALGSVGVGLGVRVCFS